MDTNTCPETRRSYRVVRAPATTHEEESKRQLFVNDYYLDDEVFQDPRERVRDPKLLGKLNAFLEDVGTNPNDIDFTDSYWCKRKQNRVLYEPKLSYDDLMVRVPSDNEVVVKTEFEMDQRSWSGATVKVETPHEMAVRIKSEIPDKLTEETKPAIVKTEVLDTSVESLPVFVKTEIPGTDEMFEFFGGEN